MNPEMANRIRHFRRLFAQKTDKTERQTLLRRAGRATGSRRRQRLRGEGKTGYSGKKTDQSDRPEQPKGLIHGQPFGRQLVTRGVGIVAETL